MDSIVPRSPESAKCNTYMYTYKKLYATLTAHEQITNIAAHAKRMCTKTKTTRVHEDRNTCTMRVKHVCTRTQACALCMQNAFAIYTHVHVHALCIRRVLYCCRLGYLHVHAYRLLAFPLLCSNSGSASSGNKLLEAIQCSHFGHVKLIDCILHIFSRSNYQQIVHHLLLLEAVNQAQ